MEPSEQELGGELWQTLPSNAVEWMPSNYCSHFAMIILAREARLRSALEKTKARLDQYEKLTNNIIMRLLSDPYERTTVKKLVDAALQGGSDGRD